MLSELNELPIKTKVPGLQNMVIEETRKFRVINAQTDGDGNIIGFNAIPEDPGFVDFVEGEFRKATGMIITFSTVIFALILYALLFAS